jgi:iron complex outermembrane receptor protein
LGEKLVKARYKISCAVAALLSSCAGAAFAADPAAAPKDVATLTVTDTSTDASASGSSVGVSEIIVTAERRDESIQSVPATIQAFTGQVLQQQNITTLNDLIKYTPNVTFGNNGPGQGVIFMRGLSAGLQGNQSSATIATFPNVALYLDDQSMQFPGRNVDVYAVDLERVEVLEGPQGTLFGGGAEAGAIRYITNKPKLGAFEASAEANAGITEGGDPNYAFNAVFNVPVGDKAAVRLVLYDDHHGGYIDNVPSTFTRSNNDAGNAYFNITPNAAGACPNGLPAGGSHNLCTLPGAPQANNFDTARNNFNPVDYQGARLSGRYDINDDWNLLVSESFQSLDAEGLSVEYPTGSDFQPLGPLQVTAFTPAYDRDSYSNTAWTLNGKLGPLKAVYTGSYLLRHINQQMDYSNYSRSVEGTYYACTGGTNGLVGAGTPLNCFSPVSSWLDQVRNTHLSNEFRVSTPDDWRIRGIAGVYQENFRIYDNMNFNYKTIPDCSTQNLTIALAGGQPCLANVTTAPGSTANVPGQRSDSTAFGEDTQRGYDQIALFGSVDFDVIPHVLTISAGTRWYQYKEFEVGSEYETGAACLNVPNGGCVGYNPATGSGGGMFNIDSHNDHVTYSGFKSRANITWHVTPDVLTYFTYSEGFRPGGFNRTVGGVAPFPVITPGAPLGAVAGASQFEKPNGYAPDSLTNYEIGLKSEFFDHRLQLNLTAYHMEWDNVQLLFFNPTELGNTTFGINGPNYDVNGGEVQFIGKVTDALTIEGSGTYNQDRQANSPCLVSNIAGSPSFGQCITQIFQKGVGATSFENPFGAVGTVPAFSPAFQGDIRARYDWLIGEYKAFVQVGGSYTGSQFNQPATYASGTGVLVPNTTLLRYEMPGYGTLDASVGISKDNWYASIYGTNLTDSHASMFTSSTQFIKSEVPIRPAVVMLKIGAHF